MPPGPVTVTRRTSGRLSSDRTTPTSRSRPISGVSGAGSVATWSCPPRDPGGLGAARTWSAVDSVTIVAAIVVHPPGQARRAPILHRETRPRGLGVLNGYQTEATDAMSIVPTRVAGVVLAAGRSARLGRPKQLLDLGGRPVLVHVLANARAAALDDLILVLGHEAQRIRATIASDLAGVQVVDNPRYTAGQSTSLHTGLRAVATESDAAVVLLGDQPQVGPDVIDALIAMFRETGAPIVMPSYGGVPANPVLIARSLFPEVLAVAGDQGAREVVRAHRADTAFVPFPDRRPPADIDTEADYESLRQSWPHPA